MITVHFCCHSSSVFSLTIATSLVPGSQTNYSLINKSIMELTKKVLVLKCLIIGQFPF